MASTNKSAANLGARQWLEWYADSHAERSPMDGKAYLPAGRKAFYYAHDRKDIQERHGVTEAEAADARAYALASLRSNKVARGRGSDRRQFWECRGPCPSI